MKKLFKGSIQIKLKIPLRLNDLIWKRCLPIEKEIFELKEKITFSNFELCRYPLNGVQENRK